MRALLFGIWILTALICAEETRADSGCGEWESREIVLTPYPGINRAMEILQEARAIRDLEARRTFVRQQVQNLKGEILGGQSRYKTPDLYETLADLLRWGLASIEVNHLERLRLSIEAADSYIEAAKRLTGDDQKRLEKRAAAAFRNGGDYRQSEFYDH